MGFFSFRTADTDREIWNTHTSKPTKVTVVWPNNEKWIGATNDGYGRFHGKDIYTEIALRNGWEDRNEAIEKLSAVEGLTDFTKAAEAGYIVPKFFSSANLNYTDIAGFGKSSEYQGYFGDPHTDN